jgi:hypothetical protein
MVDGVGLATADGQGIPASYAQGMGAEADGGGTVSLRAEVPEPLLRAMGQFIECHPNWDQYRLFQAALAGFLVQNGVHDRDVTRCYLANLFPGQGSFAPLAPRVGRAAGPLGPNLPRAAA